MGAADPRIFAPELLADALLELGERFHADLLCQLVIDRNFVGGLDALHLDVELRVLAGELFRAVTIGEAHIDGPRITRFCSDQLILETGNERAAAERQVEIFRLPALKRFAVDSALEIDGDGVTLLRRRAL